MNFKPLHDRVVVKRIDKQEVSSGGIIIPPSAQKKMHEGTVVAVGPGKRLEDGTLVPVDVDVGDHVLFGKYQGAEVDIEHEKYLIVAESELFGVLHD